MHAYINACTYPDSFNARRGNWVPRITITDISELHFVCLKVDWSPLNNQPVLLIAKQSVHVTFYAKWNGSGFDIPACWSENIALHWLSKDHTQHWIIFSVVVLFFSTQSRNSLHNSKWRNWDCLHGIPLCQLIPEYHESTILLKLSNGSLET